MIFFWFCNYFSWSISAHDIHIYHSNISCNENNTAVMPAYHRHFWTLRKVIRSFRFLSVWRVGENRCIIPTSNIYRYFIFWPFSSVSSCQLACHCPCLCHWHLNLLVWSVCGLYILYMKWDWLIVHSLRQLGLAHFHIYSLVTATMPRYHNFCYCHNGN